MMNQISIQDILYLDIETIPAYEKFDELSSKMQLLWDQKTKYRRADEESAEDYYQNAGIWSEFGKIICISVGFINIISDKPCLRLKSFYGKEQKILTDFKELLDDYFNKKNNLLCAHNGKEFDFPFIAHRMIINHISLPEKLNLMGKKPWEVPHIDTMEMWKFGSYKHYTSIDLLTEILGIESPKSEMDGSKVYETYYHKNDINKIVRYCQRDVVSLVQVFLRLLGKPMLTKEEIKYP